MKNLYILLAIALIFIIGFKSYLLADTLSQTVIVHSLSQGEIEKFYLLYDGYYDDDKLLSCTHSNKSSGVYLVDWRKTFSYDINGRKIGWINENYNNGNWINYRNNLFIYDEKGNIIEWRNEIYSSGLWIPYFHVLYKFNDENRIVSALTESWTNYSWNMYSLDTTVYTVEVQYRTIDTTTTMNWNGSAWIIKSRRILEKNMHLSKDFDRFEQWNQDRWTPVWLKEYTFDNYWYSPKSEETWYIFQNDSFQLSYRKTFQYEKYNMVKVINEKWDTDKWIEFDGNLDFVDCKNNFFQYLKQGYKIDIIWDKVTSNIDNNSGRLISLNVSPNPFSETTSINYELQTAGRVKIDIFNSLGEKITTLVDEWQEAGRHNYELRIRNYELSVGMYYYRIQIGDRIESGKLLLIK